MQIRQSEEGEEGRFFAVDGEEEIGGMYYTYAPDGKMIIDHTEVSEAYEGKGIGKELLSSLVDFVRVKKIKVIPHCTYAVAVFKKTSSWQDVLADH
ncbi:MAG: N-acetyltransferase [Chitinophagaceae bacterium]|nr:MAG: N-acetyltransferase [Chitinophagaceae bacterium]